MKRELKLNNEIKKDFSFLFDKYRFNIVDSKLLPMNGFELILKYENLNIRFELDRGGIWIIEVFNEKDKNQTFSLGTIREYFTNSRIKSRMSLEEMKYFLIENLDKIFKIFDFKNYEKTKISLQNLEKEFVKKTYPNFFK